MIYYYAKFNFIILDFYTLNVSMILNFNKNLFGHDKKNYLSLHILNI